MTAKLILDTVVDPTLAWLPTIGVITPAGNAPRLHLLAISGIEANWEHRRQLGGGPAHGLWQFEGGPMSGLAEVLLKCPQQAAAVCHALGVPPSRESIYEELVANDRLACAMARLLLFSDPKPLPMVGDQWASWDCYVRNWHPGAPRPSEWPGYYQTALDLVKGTSS